MLAFRFIHSVVHSCKFLLLLHLFPFHLAWFVFPLFVSFSGLHHSIRTNILAINRLAKLLQSLTHEINANMYMCAHCQSVAVTWKWESFHGRFEEIGLQKRRSVKRNCYESSLFCSTQSRPRHWMNDCFWWWKRGKHLSCPEHKIISGKSTNRIQHLHS